MHPAINRGVSESRSDVGAQGQVGFRYMTGEQEGKRPRQEEVVRGHQCRRMTARFLEVFTLQ